jgi:ribosomal protein S18 acetylase RimI-like enzyme
MRFELTGAPENIAWHSLIGPHAKFAVGSAGARRYLRGFSPIAAFANRSAPDFRALHSHCETGEELYIEGWKGRTPSGWNVLLEASMFLMAWEGATPAQDPFAQAVPLQEVHAQQALELAGLTHPGPFGPRTIELGEYFGLFEGSQLVAMAGERMFADNHREISGVCTHPQYQGRGLARRLMMKLIHREVLRGEVPVLHVVGSNTVARGLYERMGFRDLRETVVRVVARG